MGIHGPILAAIDLGPAADEVLRQASAMAAELRARLLVCHIVPPASRIRVLFPHTAMPDPATQQSFQRRVVDAIGNRVRAVTQRAAEEFAVVVDAGSPHSGVLAQAESAGAGLVVLGPGTTAERVTRHAASAVLIVRASPRGAVLGATDFSDASLPAIETAAAESKRRGAPLRVIHSLEIADAVVLATPYLGVLPALPAEVVQDLERDAVERLRASVRRFGGDGECLVSREAAVSAIIDAACQVPTELIVVGTRGRTRLPRLLLGSVAEAVIHAAPCSVLAVRLAP